MIDYIQRIKAIMKQMPIIKNGMNKRKSESAENRMIGRIYESLSPIDDVKDGEEYLAALGWALSQKNIRNIAISGPYGSGKSSTIKSYLKKNKRSDVVYISLAAFDLDEERETKEQNGYGKLEEKLEAAILKQLFYSVEGKRIPQSRYRKLQTGIKWRSFFAAVALTVIGIALLFFIFPDKANAFIQYANSFGGKWNYFIYILLSVSAIYIFVCIVGCFSLGGNIKEINILNKATIESVASSEESIFNKNMDEIIYFFESTKKKIVIIEDLDRFENASIFVALREVNSVINNNEKIRDTVKFVYAIKDDIFKRTGERTKFFDFIVPIVPYISSTNSGEILRKKMENELYDISDKYISLVSPYINDMRDMVNICNEFNIFKNTLKSNQQLNLVDEKMLSMVIYKNLYPKDFAAFEEESASSLIRKAFTCKRNFISHMDSIVEDKKENKENELNEIEKEELHNIKELKLALLHSLLEFEYAIDSVEIIEDKKKMNLKYIMNDIFDVSLLKKKLNIYYYKTSTLSQTKYVDNPEEIIKMKGDYFTRIDRVKKGLDKCWSYVNK